MRTIDDVLRDYDVILSGRTRYEGQEPRDDELMIAEITRLRTREGAPLPRWRHIKRRTEYIEIGRGKAQVAGRILDDEGVVIYRGDDGSLWVRPIEEFEDGRFAKIEATEACAAAVRRLKR